MIRWIEKICQKCGNLKRMLSSDDYCSSCARAEESGF